MVAQQLLELPVGVRIPARQPSVGTQERRSSRDSKGDFESLIQRSSRDNEETRTYEKSNGRPERENDIRHER